MHERILQQMRTCIRTKQYVMTVHATEEMHDDDLSVYDVERAVLTGTITERQKDSATGEWKYGIKGQALDGERILVVGKISLVSTLVMITVFRD